MHAVVRVMLCQVCSCSEWWRWSLCWRISPYRTVVQPTFCWRRLDYTAADYINVAIQGGPTCRHLIST